VTDTDLELVNDQARDAFKGKKSHRLNANALVQALFVSYVQCANPAY